ncbi:MAG: heparan-alpha-glucosaminide N-acetyltransferase [bacterium]|nr:heparan-alpha-glucosaminide N-acetyltransferase [bacterium]
MDNKKNRFRELDLLRGFAVLAMIVFHAFFLLDYYGEYSFEMFSGWWHVLGQFVRFSFLGLVGISMVISYQKSHSRVRQLYRGFKVLIFAMLVSFVTYFAVGEEFIRFGILHLIAFSIIVLSFIVDRKYISLLIGILLIYLPFLNENINSLLFIDFGKYGIDYFPIFPWMGIVAFGIFLGHFLYPKGEALFKIDLPQKMLGLYWFGKKALWIYMVHVPIIIGVFWAIGLLKPF